MNKQEVRYVDTAVLEQVSVALAGLREDPRFDLQRQHRAYHFIGVEAARHSVDLEFPKGKRSRKGSFIRGVEENLRAAQSYFQSNYKGIIDERVIMDTVGLIEPSLRPVSYRSPDGPMTMAAGMQMVYPRDVSPKMESFIKDNGSLINPLDKAFHAHFHLTRIHPFKDGNGRLARLVQNGVLSHESLPAVVIEPFERDQYMDLLNAAQRAYAEKEEVHCDKVSSFYNYLAIKLRDSLVKAKRSLAH